MRKSITRLTAILLSGSVLINSVFGFALTVKADSTTSTSTSAEAGTSTVYTSELLAEKYTHVSAEYTAKPYEGEQIEIPIDQAFQDGTATLINATDMEASYEYKNPVLKMEIEQTGTVAFDVKETGIYYISFDYLSFDSSILPVEMTMKVNGEFPFYEARRLLFESEWKNQEEMDYDRYGNQIVAIPNKVMAWNNKYVMDASYRHSDALGIELQAGKNTIELGVSEGNVLIGNVYLNKETKVETYTSSEKAEGDAIYTLQGESPASRNDSSIRALCEYDVDVTPYNVKSRELNTLDGTSFKDAGQTVTYEQNVEKAGYYYIALNYKQSDKSDFPVFVDVKVDGVICNTEFKDYPFPYGKGYKTTTLQDDDKNYLSVYLEEGVHTISFTISMDPVCHVMESVEAIMSEINNLSLEITKVAGTNKDKYRDLDMESYIPGVGQKLIDYADELEALVDSVRCYNTKVKQIGVFSSVSVASNQLRSLAKEPNKLPYRIAELSTSVSSVTRFLANLLDDLNKNNLYIDRLYLYQASAKLPKGTGFFKSIGMNVSRFFNSFSEQAYSVSSTDDTHLQVWVNRSRQYLEIMQKMIDESFTKETGIQVDLSLMPDQNKLVLANASGDAPDIATGINYAIPFELGIRGAIKDLTEFDDFAEIASRYTEGLLVPATIEDGIYALPETRNFWVMYYRTDVLEKLGLEVPETMDDVRDMLPELQMRGLNFYYPTAGMLAMKTFHGTTPLLFQNGATLYGEYAGDTTINSEAAVKGFTELTELFTIYNLPKDVPSFYQHFRNGDLPIGIADYSVYNLLINAAPEIANSWGIALVPGVEQENGEVVHYSSGGAESTVMFTSNDEKEAQAWEFMKWWSSAEVQAEFGQTLQITYGDEYIWSTANTEAFSELAIRSEDKKVIVEQDKWIVEAPRILGTYMLEREMSNAYNYIVVNGKNLRTTLDNAVKRIDRETERKLEEFGYMKDGKVIKNYTVPTIETVREILNKTK
ncbi:extracellular solute-binding protein [Anaerosporobacter sp.]|uniref:extracellular solute-binding protein n=1 Tax=Anaerosporobacter sp. TaxID=1872529 RepID=UPI00286F987F|nr:extracellular solute-binding protein [Anaerosporobacter sp.]